MSPIQNSSKLVLLALVLSIFTFGCKSAKKTAAANAAAEKAKMEQEASVRRQREEDLKKREAEEKAKRDAESTMNVMKENAPKVKLSEYFNAVSSADNLASANSSINEALALFASAETPVLIIISEEGGKKDYDRPTTIKSYLNYLKDQKKNINNIESLKLDDAGKITEIELRKGN